MVAQRYTKDFFNTPKDIFNKNFAINGQRVSPAKCTLFDKYLLATDPQKGELLFIYATSPQIVKSVTL